MSVDESLRESLRQRDDTALDNLYYEGPCRHFFAVDWRQDDAHTVEECAECLGLQNLHAQWRDDDLVITYNGEETKAPLVESAADRHITIETVNRLLAPDFEIRFFVGSQGDDTGGFIALSAEDWATLEQESPVAVNENFLRLEGLPNTFTELTGDNLPAPAKARYDRMMKRALSRKGKSRFKAPAWWSLLFLATLFAIYLIRRSSS